VYQVPHKEEIGGIQTEKERGGGEIFVIAIVISFNLDFLDSKEV
jgi:hypothetical protein